MKYRFLLLLIFVVKLGYTQNTTYEFFAGNYTIVEIGIYKKNQWPILFSALSKECFIYVDLENVEAFAFGIFSTCEYVPSSPALQSFF